MATGFFAGRALFISSPLSGGGDGGSSLIPPFSDIIDASEVSPLVSLFWNPAVQRTDANGRAAAVAARKNALKYRHGAGVNA